MKTNINYSALAELAAKFNAVGNVSVRENVVTRKYRLMYMFGAWFTASTFYCEDDREAIELAEREPRTKGMQYALFCGNRRVVSL